MKKERDHGHFRYSFVLYIILIATVLPLFILTLPVIKSNIENSTFKEHYALWKDERKEREKDYTVFLFSDDDIVEVNRKVTWREDEKHSLIEALLLPADNDEKEKGYTSFIPEGTRLIGMSEKDGFFFIEFSSPILTSSNMTKVAEQIKKTLQNYYFLESLTIISGKTILKT